MQFLHLKKALIIQDTEAISMRPLELR